MAHFAPMSNSARLKEGSFRSERRRHTRQELLFSSAEWEKDNSGIILNISESGVGLHATSEILSDELQDLRFQISPSEPWIEARGRIVWKSHSKKTAGVQFRDLTENSRQHIRNSISQANELALIVAPEASELRRAEEELSAISHAVTTEHGARADSAGVSTGPVQIPFQQSPMATAAFSGFWRRPPLYIAGLLLLAIGSYLVWRESDIAQPTADFRTAAVRSAALPNASTGSRGLRSPDPPETGFARTPASTEYGFVLQVVAVKSEKNALAVADQLRQKNFSAFVSKSGGSDLYRVLVGPYGDVATATQDEAELRREGFASILQQNKPVQ